MQQVHTNNRNVVACHVTSISFEAMNLSYGRTSHNQAIYISFALFTFIAGILFNIRWDLENL